MYIGVTYYYYYIRYTSVIEIDFLSQHPSPNHGLWDPPEKVGCRKESYMYFLEFMYVDVARDFAIIIITIIIITNSGRVCKISATS